MPGGWSSCFARAVFALIVFAILLSAILIRPPKWLTHFDQSLYLTIASDLNHHGVFSNGVLDRTSGTVAAPSPGMFFGPLYPWLVVAATKIDGRFARAVDCSVEADRKMRDGAECGAYARPIHIVHAAFLAAGVLAVAFGAAFLVAGDCVRRRIHIREQHGVLARGWPRDACASPRCRSFLVRDDRERHLCALQHRGAGARAGPAGAARATHGAGRHPVRTAVPDAPLLRSAGASRDRADRRQWSLAFADARTLDLQPCARIRARLAGGGRPVARAQCHLGREMGPDGRIRLRGAGRALRLRRHARAGIRAGLSILPARDRRSRGPLGFRPASDGEVRLFHPRKLLRGRPAAPRAAAAGAWPARSADQGPDPRRDAPARMALPPHRPALGLVRDVGRRAAGARARAAVRLGMRRGDSPAEAAVPDLRRAACRHARAARRGRQPLDAL